MRVVAAKSMLATSDASGSAPATARWTWFEAHDPISQLVFDGAELSEQTIHATALRKKALARLMHFLDDRIFEHSFPYLRAVARRRQVPALIAGQAARFFSGETLTLPASSINVDGVSSGVSTDFANVSRLLR
jgi:hypothetical protein